jgi:uncharacterized protein YkwD
MTSPDNSPPAYGSLRPTTSSAFVLAGFLLTAGTIVWRWNSLARDYLSAFNPAIPVLRQIDYLLVGIFLAMLILILAGADLRYDARLVLVGFVGGAVIETWGTHTGLWHYYTWETPPLWILPAWPTAALAIDRIARIFARVARRIPERAFSGTARVILAAFLAWMLAFTWPTIRQPLTILALALVAGLTVRPGDPRRALLTFAAGAALGLFLERWGTTRACWTYYTGATPPAFAVFAHGMASVAFWRAADLLTLAGRRLLQRARSLRPQAMRRAGGALVLAAIAGLAGRMPAAPAEAASARPSASDLIAGVNALRASYGLAPYTVDPILMAVAQTQNNYSMSIGRVTHYGPDGSRPREQAIAAGYGGGATVFVSENIAQGTDLSPGDAVQMWTGDDPHLNTMIGANYRDVGAAAGESDGVYYYTLLAGYVAGVGSAHSTAPIASPYASSSTGVVAYVVPATPMADGSILHTVQAGQTLWTIAAVYDVPLEDLRTLNRLSETPLLHPGDELIIQPAQTVVPPTPTPAATGEAAAPTPSPPARSATRTPTPPPPPHPHAPPPGPAPAPLWPHPLGADRTRPPAHRGRSGAWIASLRLTLPPPARIRAHVPPALRSSAGGAFHAGGGVAVDRRDALRERTRWTRRNRVEGSTGNASLGCRTDPALRRHEGRGTATRADDAATWPARRVPVPAGTSAPRARSRLRPADAPARAGRRRHRAHPRRRGCSPIADPPSTAGSA